jgi:hypothetical protein
VLKAARTSLRDKPQKIYSQFPQEIGNRRRELVPIMKDFRDNGHFLCWMSSKLVISHMSVSLLSWIKQSINSSRLLGSQFGALSGFGDLSVWSRLPTTFPVHFSITCQPQFPQEIGNRRRELVPIMKDFRDNGHRAYIDVDKLY